MMLHSQQKGTGKTIVFIHGCSQSLATWNDLIHQPSLALYNTIGVDMPGHGHSFRSNHPEQDYSFHGMGLHLKNFLESLPSDYIVVTNSLSANLIAEVITELSRCKGLFFIGASVIGPQFPVQEIAKPNPYFEVTFNPFPSDEELEGFIGSMAVHLSPLLTNEHKQMFSNTDPALRTRLGAAIAMGEWGDEIANLEQLDYPIAIVYGEDEKVIFTDYLSQSAIKMWTNRIIKVPNSGHYCHLDQPKQLAALIDQYAKTIFRSADS